MRRHRFLLFLPAVFAAKLVVVLQLRDHPLLQPDAGVDTTIYTRLAASVAGGNTWLAPGLYVVSRLYGYFLAGILGVASSLVAARVAQIVIGTAAVACVFAATRVWFGDRAAWVASLFAALTGLFTFHEALLLPSALLTAAALAALAVALESPSLAVAFFNAAVAASPRVSRPRQDLGRALSMLGRHREAIGQFEQAVALDPADPAGQLNLAVAYRDAGRLAEARARAEQALRLRPDYQPARQFLRGLK